MQNKTQLNEVSDFAVNISKDVSREYLFPNVRDRIMGLNRETMYTLRQFEVSVRESINELQIVSTEVEKFKDSVNEIIRNIENSNTGLINNIRNFDSSGTFLENTDLVTNLIRRAELLARKTTDLEKASKEIWDKANKGMEVFIKQKDQFYAAINKVDKELTDAARDINKMESELNKISEDLSAVLKSFENNNRIINNIKNLLSDSVEKMVIFLLQDIKYRESYSEKIESKIEEIFNIVDNRNIHLKDLSLLKDKNYTEVILNQRKKVSKEIILLYVINILAIVFLCILLLKRL